MRHPNFAEPRDTPQWVAPAAIGGGLALAWILALWAKKTPPSPTLPPKYNSGQADIIDRIRAEAPRQGVPPEIALAFSQLESNFASSAKSSDGSSYGPMQVNKVHLRAGQTLKDLQNLDFNIALGVSIIKDYLKRARGNTELARIFYRCGPAYQKSCKPETIEHVKTRWATAAAQWGVPAVYPAFSG